MLNIRLTDDLLYGKYLFTWMLAVAVDVFDGVLFCAVFFFFAPGDVLGEIWE